MKNKDNLQENWLESKEPIKPKTGTQRLEGKVVEKVVVAPTYTTITFTDGSVFTLVADIEWEGDESTPCLVKKLSYVKEVFL